MKLLHKINNKEELKQDNENMQESSQSPSKREACVLGQVTNSFVTHTAHSEMKGGEVLGQIGENHEMSSAIGGGGGGGQKPAVASKKATATTDAKKKWMRRI